MLLISDGGDWTRFNPKMEVPHINRIYAFYDAENNFENVHLPNEKHDYGPSKRQAAYHFLAKHLNLDIEKVNLNGTISEKENQILTENELRVFNDTYPRPSGALIGNETVISSVNAF